MKNKIKMSKEEEEEEFDKFIGKLKKNFINDMQRLLSTYTSCQIQHKGYPCVTCFSYLCTMIGLDEKTAQKFWDVVLVLRGDYTPEEIDRIERNYQKRNKGGKNAKNRTRTRRI